jgi:hypothetical protein
MMPKAERFEPPTVDTCGYHTPPPWTVFQVAEHRWFHHQAGHIRRTVRGEPDTRSDLEAMVTAADGYITALVAQAKRQRSRIFDLEEELQAAQWDLKVSSELVDELKAELEEGRR